MSHREEASGKTQDTLERLCLSARLAWERLGVPPEELEEVSGVREVWASLLRLLPPATWSRIKRLLLCPYLPKVDHDLDKCPPPPNAPEPQNPAAPQTDPSLTRPLGRWPKLLTRPPKASAGPPKAPSRAPAAADSHQTHQVQRAQMRTEGKFIPPPIKQWARSEAGREAELEAEARD
ncbi:hypothetical protein L3Q82_014673 [Scortum barcoo]|uniref:Uncharacterized protein n=1 Tax=Scortum barcoo TaxID=214431 RepID=A0ACB8VRW5_9TELE|nr:hypothetical protein L3Q82_014673 [Scortum barcoo]